MKHTLKLITLSTALLLASHTWAQVPVVSKVTKALPKVTLGLKAGANFQTLTGSTWASSYKPGIVGGAFVGVSKGKWGVEAEALIKSARFDVNSSLGSGYVKSMYLDIPLLLEYKLVPRVWLQAGPQFSDLLSAKNNSGTDVKTIFKSSDISGVLGVEVKLPVHLIAGARYVLGFSDMNNTSASGVKDSWKNRYAQVYIGFRFL